MSAGAVKSLQNEQSLTAHGGSSSSTATQLAAVQLGLTHLLSQFSEFKHAVEDELMEMKHSAEASGDKAKKQIQEFMSKSQHDTQHSIQAALADLQQTHGQQVQDIRALAQQEVQALMQQEKQRLKEFAAHCSSPEPTLSKVAHGISQSTVEVEAQSPQSQIIALDQAGAELKTAVAALQSELDEQRKQIGSLEERLENVTTRDACARLPGNDKSCADLDDAVIDINRDSVQHQETVMADTGLSVAEKVPVNEFSWSATVWEASIFLWLPEFGSLPSLSLLLATALNILIQGYFCVVLCFDRQFTGQDHFSEMLPYVKKWRFTDGHHNKHVDSEDLSLVARVCHLDPSLSVAGAQTSLLEEINTYFSMDHLDLKVKGFPTGPMLCVMCIAFFALLIIREMRQVTFLVLSLCMLPHRKTQLTEGCFLAVSSIRFYASLFLCMIRMLFATALLISGVLWLSSTSSTQDLILNAAALGFVMDIDEMLFVTLVPEHGVQMVNRLQPLRFPKIPAFIDAFLPLALLGTIVLVADLKFVSPNIDDMLAIKRELCGGEVDFTYDTHHDMFIVLSRDTRNFKDPNTEQAVFWSGAVAEMQHRQSPVLRSFPETFAPMDASDTTQFSLHFADRGTFDYALGLTAERWSEIWSGVEDVGDYAGFYSWFNTVRFLAGTSMEQPWRCGDFLPFCNDMGFEVLRLICPATCGCNDHASGLYQTKGCPALSPQIAREKLESMQCVDIDLSSSAAQASWNRYWDGFEIVYINKYGGADDTFVSDLRTSGCDVATLVSVQSFSFSGSWDPCQQIPSMASFGENLILGFCPATCCKIMNTSEGCPRHCFT